MAPTSKQAAIAAMNGQETGGRSLTVNEARPRENTRGGSSGGGSYSGGRGRQGGHGERRY